MKYVIIGNSAAAIGTVEGIRQVDQNGEIVLISKETQHTYSRPLISYLLLGKTDLQRMKYRPDDFYEKNGCKVMLDCEAVKISPDTKTVLLSSGEQIAYDKLMIATGSRPFIPPMAGMDTVKDKFTFMSLDDAQALGKALTPEARVLIIGAGLIGLKCAEGIEKSVQSITVVDLANRILPSILDEAGSALVQAHIEQKGIRMILGQSVKLFEGNTAHLTDGTQLDFDILVIAVGVRPNTQLASDAGVEVGRGILTDVCCRTNKTDIYAAGDCTESYDITVKQSRILALLPNAYMQGETAGITMAGGKAAYDRAIPMNSIGFFGLHIITAGSYDGEAYVEQDEKHYKKLVVRDGKLCGYILIGEVSRAGIYTSLIRNQTDLNTVDFELLKQRPQLMAFCRKDRAVMLGGERS